jgi:hypothetical protein
MDQDTLPPYEVLDEILEGLVCDHLTLTDLVERGFDRAMVEQVSRLLRRAKFKRRQARPGLKVTDRAFGTGWQMPIEVFFGMLDFDRHLQPAQFLPSTVGTCQKIQVLLLLCYDGRPLSANSVVG